MSVTEGSNVGIHLIAQGTCNLGFSVNLIFQDGSASELVVFGLQILIWYSGELHQ